MIIDCAKFAQRLRPGTLAQSQLVLLQFLHSISHPEFHIPPSLPPDAPDRTDEPTPTPRGPELGDPGIAPGSVTEPEPVFCGRCGETAPPVKNSCRWCGAWLIGPRPRAVPVLSLDDDEPPEDDWDADVARADYVVPEEPPPPFPPLVVVFVCYGLLIGSLIGLAFVAGLYDLTSEEDLNTALTAVGMADGVMTLIALGMVWRAARHPVPEGTRAVAWVVALPVLFAVLCLNFLYMTVLRDMLRPLGVPPPTEIKVTLVTVFIICVQPGIVEELFFRQMMLGVFRRYMGMHTAVWVTGSLFAFAHLGNPLGMPYLLLLGGLLGYARVYGGLSLAMFLHFAHNLAVITYAASR
jgi:membrane protease YdiL (CAAX protease family)